MYPAGFRAKFSNEVIYAWLASKNNVDSLVCHYVEISTMNRKRGKRPRRRENNDPVKSGVSLQMSSSQFALSRFLSLYYKVPYACQ